MPRFGPYGIYSTVAGQERLQGAALANAYATEAAYVAAKGGAAEKGIATLDTSGATTIAVGDVLGNRGTTAGESATTTTANAGAAVAREEVAAGTPNYIKAMVRCF